MPINEYLTTGEFERWTRGHDTNMKRILDHIEHQEDEQAKAMTEIALLKANQQACSTSSAKVSVGISAVVTAVTQGLIAAFTSRG